LSDKLFCKVITAPTTQSAAFTVFVVWAKDRTYYLTDKQMRDCIVLFVLTRTRWFMDIEFTILIMKTMCKYLSVPCSAGIRENFAWFEGSYTSNVCPADKRSFRIMLVDCCRQVTTKHSENIPSECHIFPAQMSHDLALY